MLQLIVLFAFLLTFSLTDVLRSEENPNAKFVGISKCGSSGCHGNAKLGNQTAKWEDSGHGKATTDLGTKKAKEYAAKLKIADPMKADLCMSCHVTAHGVPEERLMETFTGDQGVECEMCHGAGSLYLDSHKKKERTMADLVAKGLRPLKTEKEIKDNCMQCHGATEKWEKIKASGHSKLDKTPFDEALKKTKHPLPKT
ncbi:MAG: multiheme c-type cytochrome [Nitrospirota bacterium]